MKFLSVLLMTFAAASTASAQQRDDRPRPPSITVSGEATISAEPNQAQIDIGVVTQARTAPDASKENAERLTRVMAEIKKILGKEDDVKTSVYALTPTYRYPQGGKPEIVGYTATNTLRIKTGRLDQVSRLIDAAMQSGANNVSRLVFTLKDEHAAQLEALRMASAKARTKAEAVASALGLKIVRISSVAEGERAIQPIFRQVAAARGEALAASPTPVEPGTVEIRSTVSMTVEVGEK